jgi:hypothetical protein
VRPAFERAGKRVRERVLGRIDVARARREIREQLAVAFAGGAFGGLVRPLPVQLP